jgi:hypothetical protein
MRINGGTPMDAKVKPSNFEGMAEVEQYLFRQAHTYISGRECEFELLRDRDITQDCSRYILKMSSKDRVETRNHVHMSTDQPYESLDIMVAKLTHMAVEMGLIETTPKDVTHNISMTGTDGGNAEVQIDGHTLRGLYSFSATVDASGDCKVDLGFSRSKVYLDQDFLPENMTLKIQGMDEFIAVTEKLLDTHRDKMRNLEYAKVIDHELNDVWQQLYDVLNTYKPVQSGEDLKVH